MGRLSKFASGHVGVTIAAAVAASFACASLVARTIAVHAPAAADPTARELPSAEPNERLDELREAHTPTTAEALDYLTAGVWVSGDGTLVVEWTDELVCVRERGRESCEPFAVTASERRQATGPGVAGVWTLCVETPDWTDIATLTVPAQAQPGTPAASPTLACRSLAPSDLEASRELRTLVVEGPDEATLEGCGTSAEELGPALAGWVADWHPTAERATWDRTVLEDRDRGVFEVGYVLDDRRQTSVTVSVSMEDHEIEIREGRRW